MPIYLPALDPDAKLCVTDTTGGVLKMSSSPGFSLTLAPGAATFPGGSRTGCVTVTPVNPDKVPMVPGFGQQPRYVVTIQPVGTIFNPPAAITIPNMDGLAPNAKTEMYSYDHDLAAFVAIGSGTVSADGSVIASDPGIGVMKAGWHCGGNPNSTGSAGTCLTCQKCQGSQCIADSNKDGQACVNAAAQPGVYQGGQCDPLGRLELTVPADNITFHISAQPTMPVIVARAQIFDVLPDPTSTSLFNWNLSIKYTGLNGRSTSGQYQATSIVGGHWTPYTATSAIIRGGDAVFDVSTQRIGQTLSDKSVGIRILGTNPTQVAVNTLLGGFPATNIACWESLRRLAQFDVNGLPLFGGPNGYGIMQVDNPPVSDDGIWNWRQNVQEGLAILATKRQDATGYPRRIQNQFPNSQVPDFCALGTIDS